MSCARSFGTSPAKSVPTGICFVTLYAKGGGDSGAA